MTDKTDTKPSVLEGPFVWETSDGRAYSVTFLNGDPYDVRVRREYKSRLHWFLLVPPWDSVAGTAVGYWFDWTDYEAALGYCTPDHLVKGAA